MAFLSIRRGADSANGSDGSENDASLTHPTDTPKLVRQLSESQVKLIFATLALCLSTAPAAAADKWVGAWAASPAPPQPAGAPIPPPAPTFNDQTLVQTVRLSAGGSRLRVRFTNEYGSKPLVIGAARLSIGEVARDLTFSGRPGVSIPPGAPMLSDPVDLPVRPLTKLKIATFLPEATPECTCHVVGGENIAVSPKGDFTQRPFQPERGLYLAYRAFLSEVDVSRSAPARTVVAFGDSITDGYQSTVGADHRYPDRLAERLLERFAGGNVAVTNAGISGNRLLADGRFISMGQSALTRFDRDVLSVPGVSHVIVSGRRERHRRRRRHAAERRRPDRRLPPDHRPSARPRNQGRGRDDPALRGRGLLQARG